MSILPLEIRQRMLKQKYQLCGKQTAVKKCNWTHNALRNQRFCYKQHYGILCHRCIQATPILICNQMCVFCWRTQERDLGLKPLYKQSIFENANQSVLEELFDDPETVMECILTGWKRIICGYKPFVTTEMYEESINHPKHITFSLAGEPLLYPWYVDLVKLFLDKDFSVFTVSNGTVPERILEMKKRNIFPDQLYITLPGPSKKVYQRTCQPLIKDGWERANQTLELIGDGINTRTVARLTLAKEYNLTDAKGYSTLIEKMNPSFIEVKGVVHVGAAQKRIPRSSMPDHPEIQKFSQELSTLTGYKIAAESIDSKLVILTNHSKPLLIKRLKADLLRYKQFLNVDFERKD